MIRIESNPRATATSPVWRGCAGALCMLLSSAALADMHALIVQGLGGEEGYTEQFNATAEALRRASQSLGGAQVTTLAGETATREKILAQFRMLAKTLKADDRVAVYFIGHGSYDGYEFKFNIPGPDLTGAELAKSLDALPAKNQLVVLTGSASGAVADALKKASRVVITATRSGNERNVTYFVTALAQAIDNAASDVDKNGRITVQEAFDAANRAVKDHYEREKRLASEHPRLEGELAARFTLAQLGAAGAAGAGAVSAAQPERERLNSQIEELRLRKDGMSEAQYAAELERLLLELAQLEERLEQGGGAP